MRWLSLAFVVAAGCASTAPSVGHDASAQRYTGDPYDVYSQGNRISGLVCGVSVDYEIRSEKNGVQLIGSGRPVYLQVSNEAGGRRITGALGNRTGVNEVDLFVTDASLKGKAGVRRFDLRANGDDLVGPMTALNTLGSVEALVAGRGELGKLPDAELGAIVPTLLNCSAPMSRSIARQGIAVRIGGPAGYDTRYSNEIGRAN